MCDSLRTLGVVLALTVCRLNTCRRKAKLRKLSPEVITIIIISRVIFHSYQKSCFIHILLLYTILHGNAMIIDRCLWLAYHHHGSPRKGITDLPVAHWTGARLNLASSAVDFPPVLGAFSLDDEWRNCHQALWFGWSFVLTYVFIIVIDFCKHFIPHIHFCYLHWWTVLYETICFALRGLIHFLNVGRTQVRQ